MAWIPAYVLVCTTNMELEVVLDCRDRRHRGPSVGRLRVRQRFGSRDSTPTSDMVDDGVAASSSDVSRSAPPPEKKGAGEHVACTEPTRKKPRWEKPIPLANAELRSRTRFVPARQQTLLRLPSGVMKQVTLEPGKMISIGKFGTFKADEIIGRPFGLTYEILADGSLKIMQQAVAEALGMSVDLTVS